MGALASFGAWWETLSHWAVMPWATIALLVAGCLLLYHDLLTPTTWGVTGTLGVLCVGLVFASQITIGDTGWVGVILLLLGLACILLEIHAFPGQGSALAGFILMFAGMFLSLGGTRNTAFALTVTTILIIVSGLAFLAYLPKSPAWQRLSQQMAQAQMTGQLVGVHGRESINVGQTGHTLSVLRPSGTASFGGVEINVVTEGDFLDEGASIIVSAIEGERIVVDALPDAATQASDLVTSAA